jgi:hypothetical protein
MWSRTKKSASDCTQFLEQLESAASDEAKNVSAEVLLAGLPAPQQRHASGCDQCRMAAEELLATRALLRKLPLPAAVREPWFAARVMAAIALREEELRQAAGTWIAVPRLASRFAVACGAALIVVSTWLYQKPNSRPSIQPTAAASSEYLFEPPAAPMTHDDVLISLAEDSQ